MNDDKEIDAKQSVIPSFTAIYHHTSRDHYVEGDQNSKFLNDEIDCGDNGQMDRIICYELEEAVSLTTVNQNHTITAAFCCSHRPTKLANK